MSQFADTFKVLKNDKRYFGVPDIVNNRIDEAIFFNKDETECLLMVLKRNDRGLVFGTVRLIRGMVQNDKWVFKPGLEYTYDKSYFEHYPANSFENISNLARYSVLSDGDVKKSGCAIDDDYWFEKLKR